MSNVFPKLAPQLLHYYFINKATQSFLFFNTFLLDIGSFFCIYRWRFSRWEATRNVLDLNALLAFFRFSTQCILQKELWKKLWNLKVDVTLKKWTFWKKLHQTHSFLWKCMFKCTPYLRLRLRCTLSNRGLSYEMVFETA